jgi:membrane fusion protein (multidrug efflux system)
LLRFGANLRGVGLKAFYTAVAVVGIGAASAAAWWWQNRAPAKVDAAAVAAPAASGARGAAPGGAPAASPGGPVPVEVGRVERASLADEAQAVGSLRARQSVVLRPEVSGRIAKIGFDDGQRVRRGQLLVQLDDTLQRAQVQQAQAQASIARTTLARNRELLAQGFVSQNAVDQSAASLEVAQAQVALAQAQLVRMRIDAPFDGVAGIRLVSVGDYVKDGADLVGIEDPSFVWVDFRLAERYIGRMKAGLAVEVALDALPGRAFRAEVTAVDAVLDANGRSLLVRARLANADGVLRSGMFARTRTVFAQRGDALVVPEEALVPQGGKQYLVKLVDGPSGGKLSQRIEAKIGMRIPGKAEILDGVAAGDLVVTAGQARLMRGDGLPVRVIDLDRAGARSPGAPAGGASGPATSARAARSV